MGKGAGSARLDKVLVHMQAGSRREVQALVKLGRVTIDGRVELDPGQHVDPRQHAIAVAGRPLVFQPHFHVLLHKPAGVITATDDKRQKTVLDVLPPELMHPDLFPVGRLDKASEGLLLLTTDGELGHRLLSPKWHVEKRYYAVLARPLEPDSDRAAFAEGILLADGYRCMPARLEAAGPREAVVSIWEGKYHQVRRMFAARENHVEYLRRLAMGPLELGGLPVGESRPLTGAEAAALYDSAGLVRSPEP